MYRSRQKQIAQAQPNPGHITLACMESYYSDFLLVTQNVDDLHERAGAEKMVKIHGDAWHMRCLACCGVFDVRDHDFPEEFVMETLPKCPSCGEICRPNIVWFGEYLCAETLRIATYHASICDLMIIVGTSGEVSNGYGFAEFACDNGAKIVEINPTEGLLTEYADFWVAEPAGEALPRIWGEVLSYKL
jgi:NAD-dependent deacetylase